MSGTIEILRRSYEEPPTQEEIERWVNQDPQLVLVDLSKQCNLWCELHCGYPGQQIRREEKISNGEDVEPLYTDAEILKRAIDEIADAWKEKPSLQFSADGEPLLHPRAVEIISYAARLGFDVGLTTNGTLLRRNVVEELCKAGVNLINISVDAATPETYGIVRPERHHRFNYFNTVITNIQEAVKIRNGLSEEQDIPTKFMITMILRAQSQHEQQAFIELGKELGVDKVSFRPLNSTAGLTPNFDQATALNEIEIVQDTRGIVTRVNGLDRYPCIFPFTRFSLTGGSQEGQIKFVYCPHAWDRNDADVGYYPQDGSLKELWESTLLKNIRKAHLSGVFDPNSLCGKCPDWRMVAGKDVITYADIVSDNN